MIIIKEVPGLTVKETIEALIDHQIPGYPPILTANGGFAVGEELAYRFLRTYLTAMGRLEPEIPVATPPPVEPTAWAATQASPRARSARAKRQPRKEI